MYSSELPYTPVPEPRRYDIQSLGASLRRTASGEISHSKSSPGLAPRALRTGEGIRLLTLDFVYCGRVYMLS